MEPLPLAFKDKRIFEKYLKKKPRVLSGYAFENIFVWSPLFDILWLVIDDSLCVFFKNTVGMFMPLPPSGRPDLRVLDKVFQMMEETNRNKDISRIENIEAEDVGFFVKNHFRTYEKDREYIVGQKDIAAYRGGGFRHKRNLANFFTKNYKSVFRDYREEDREGVMDLYRSWMRERASCHQDPVYRAMLEDGFKAFRVLLTHWPGLDISGKVVECDGKVRAFTSGFELSRRMFCVNFEVADLSFKGLAAFIFSEFAKTLCAYPEINIMDDSGIEGIRSTKLSFRPVATISSYTALLNA